MAKTRSNKSKYILSVAFVGAALVGLVVVASTYYRQGTNLHQAASVRGYDYEVTQIPAHPVAGRPITFKVIVSKDGQPVANTDIDMSTGHAHGIGVRGGEAPVRQIIKSDSTGNINFTYTPTFWNPLPDTYGFGVAPYETPAIQQYFINQVKTGEAQANQSTGPTFTFTVAPRWLGWFIW